MENTYQQLKDKADRYILIAKYIKPHVDEAYGIAIIQEIARDIRCENANQTSNIRRRSQEGTYPATANQKDYLQSLGVSFEPNLTKLQASELIEEAKLTETLTSAGS